MKILIADDELMVHEILQSVCGQLGYETVSVVDGQEAWEKITEDEGIRLCIIDWMMPGIDGPELCRRARERKDCHYLYIILLTSKTNSSDIVEGLNAGADDYVVKPFNFEELKKRILIGMRIVELEDRLLAAQGNLQNANSRLEEKVFERTKQLNCLYQDLKQNFVQFIRVFVDLISEYDKGLGEHCKRVAVVAKLIGQKLSLDETELEQLEVAALLHDIGLISIPRTLQENAVFLWDKNNQDQSKQHPLIGQSILKRVQSLQEVGNIIRSHHEQYDGRGYPDGLKEEAIPKPARIIRVADEYDRLKQSSVKNVRLSVQQCLNYLQKYRRSILDPNIVDAFVKALQN